MVGVTGGAALVASGASAAGVGAARVDAGASRRPGSVSAHGTLATVVHDAAADGGAVTVRLSAPSLPNAGSTASGIDAVRRVRPVGFPAGWRLQTGDLVYVDLDRDEASPHVRSAGGAWVAVNEDPRRERTIATPDRR